MDKDKTVFAMNAVATMLIEDIAEETGRPAEEILLEFMQSKTAVSLYNDSLKLWWDGPNVVGDWYKEELAAKRCGEAK